MVSTRERLTQCNREFRRLTDSHHQDWQPCQEVFRRTPPRAAKALIEKVGGVEAAEEAVKVLKRLG